ncbi:MAG TPA: type I-E CRISPR-associated protein Cas5/CasD [Terriglobia bacterium]|nr:type I-E CRISPR-associated protein Cas5/CasD [Terriglobia bacterium]HUZ46206.1 type I-E CRISPR-associated protein Cas5/CasD [Terriglobia bacterium]
MSANTLFLRLEGALQAWGDQQSKFVIRRTSEAPTKSGVIGMLCAALGVSRSEAAEGWLTTLGALRMGVRIDVPGVRWWDYHTVGAGMPMRTAEGGSKPGAMLTRREYLCDASFLVALQGEPSLIAEIEAAVKAPKWTLYLGRKCCPPSRPLLEHPDGDFPDLLTALKSFPWRRRLKDDPTPQAVECLLDWKPTEEQPEAPDDALVWYDVPVTFDPPSHQPRFVIRHQLHVGADGVTLAAQPAQSRAPAPPRPRADYSNTEYKNRRKERLDDDHHLCVFCKSPATTVQHITYRRAGGNERKDDLRSLCRYCHDAVTMIEYGLGMGLDRINPEEPRWRDTIIQKRGEIIKFRSLETRRRRLAAEEVE